MNWSLLLSEVFSFAEGFCYIVYQRIKIKNTDLQTIMIKYSLDDGHKGRSSGSHVHDAQAVLVAGSVAPGRKKFVCTTWESSIQIFLDREILTCSYYYSEVE